MVTVSQSPKLTPLDEQTFNNPSQMIKAALPYMSASSAKIMALLARCMELQNTMHYFNSPKTTLQACAIGSRRPSPEEMLSDLRKYCDGNEAETIDRFLNAMKLGHVYEKFKAMENNPDFNSILNAMSPGGSHNTNSNPHGGDTMGQSFNPEQLFKNIPPDVLKNFSPEMLKNFDMNKFNQLMKAFNSSSQGQGQKSGIQQNNSRGQQNYGSQPAKPSGGFDEDQLKSLLTPEQLELFESLKKTMKD